MIIKNFKSLATNKQKKHVLSIIEHGLVASMPRKGLQKIVHRNYLQVEGKKIDLRKYGRIFVIAMGKAALSMTNALNSLTHVDGGLVIVPKNTNALTKEKFKIIKSMHPVPDKSSIQAAEKVLTFLHSTNSDDYIIFLISGGASSLVALPDGVSLREKQKVIEIMLKCGADIGEINCVRKHLSKIKGGRLLNHLQCEAIALVMSDVVSNDLSIIASGMTYYDKTTFGDAKKVLEKYGLVEHVPKNVLKRINLGIKGKINETPKNQKIKNYIISSNKQCLIAMKTRALELGLLPKVKSCISGNVQDVGKNFARIVTAKDENCLLFGGETTVNVKGKGKGGRNQELSLHLIANLNLKCQNAVLASVGTDGIDGNTEYAGAICDTSLKSEKIQSFLENNDSFHFFKKYGGLIFTGPTQTNLMDIGVILKG